MSETHEQPEHRLKRLRMRSWRRGMREMDLLLGPFADTELTRLGPVELDAYEALLAENDQDLYRWVLAGEGGPERHQSIVRRIASYHGIGLSDMIGSGS